MQNTVKINEHGAVFNGGGFVVGWVREDACENESCLAEIRAGRPWHATPAGFAVTLPLYHYSEQDAAVAVLLEAAGAITHQQSCPVVAGREHLERTLRQNPDDEAARGARYEYYGLGDQEAEECDCGAYDRLRAAVLPNVGDRVRLAHPLDRYPHFVAPDGATGVVVDTGDPDIFAVRLDEPLAGAEDWENEVQWYLGNGDDPRGALTVLPAVSNEPDEHGVRPDGTIAVFGDPDWDETAEERRLTQQQEDEILADAVANSRQHTGAFQPAAEDAETDRTYEIASADVVLPLSNTDAQAIAEALDLFAGIDEGENTDYDNLVRLASLVRAYLPEKDQAAGATAEDRFQIHTFDSAEGDTPWCVVDHFQVGSDGERLILGRYATHGQAEDVLDALRLAYIPEDA